jgi:dihydrofolate reductase
MSKIIFDSGISLDGFFAGDNSSPNNPMGGVSAKLHRWMFKQKAFWKHIKMEGGEEYGADSKLIDDVFERTGSYIMGKRMFEEGEVVWAEDLYEADVYVLTHEKREPWIQRGTTTFYFINDGIESALKKAKQSAQGKGHKNTRWCEYHSTISQCRSCGRIFHSHCPCFFRKWYSTV